jgi:CMP-N-acetylneuraminic acid synthetase
MKFFTYIKDNSSRIPRKNFIDLGGMPLWKHLILELKSQDVFIDTDSDELISNVAEYDWVQAYRREQYHIDLESDDVFGNSPALLMINKFLDMFVDDDSELIVTPHVTSPFITLDTILTASKMINDDYDTVQACTMHKEFAYYNNVPINFDPEVIQKTQDLTPIVMGNGAFFIFTKKTFKKYKNRTGKSPYLYPLEFKEAIEIDVLEDYELARRYVE